MDNKAVVERGTISTRTEPGSANDDFERSDNVELSDAELSSNLRQKVSAAYGWKGGEDHTIRPNEAFITSKAAMMTKEQALEILNGAIKFHSDDPNFPHETFERIKLLVGGSQVIGLDPSEYELDLKVEAAIIHYHSPYPEVRSVTSLGDDPSTPIETIRAYFLGLVFMGGVTAINTFFSPRQPGISIRPLVMQCLVAPGGHFLARVLPDWGVTVFATRYSLNPGPWTYKEQVFTTIIFTAANSAGSVYYVFLVQRLPQYLGKGWVTFGYEVTLALSTQFFGLGFAGLLRRFVVYPITALFPAVFPALALNRALLTPENKGEVINGWTVSRYRFFISCSILMFCWFWIPNYIFQALRSFNWMTWIAPHHFALNMITGFWGGMGYNPWPTFDWNVAGSDILVTPFFSSVQQYAARVISGLIIIAMYWRNTYWAAYMPINSNEAFANDGTLYNVSRVIDSGSGRIDLDSYRMYGPPFFSGANVFGQGSWFAWYTMTLFSVSIRHWDSLKKTASDMYKGFRCRISIYENFTDPFTRDISVYPEVPDWWFILVLMLSLVLGIIALTVWPLNVPIWSLFAIIGVSAVLVVPAAILMASANVGMGFNVLFQLLGGIWFSGNPEALIIVTIFGQNFDSNAANYTKDQKMGHYARIPPRTVFRGQIISILLNCFIFVGMLDWMVVSYNDGSLCTWSNPQHFVCTNAVLVFASAIEYGAFGVKNMFELYPILPWCFLIGAVVGSAWSLGRRYGSSLQRLIRQLFPCCSLQFDRWLFIPLKSLHWFEPAVFWSGSLTWTGGDNLSYATAGLYFSFIFMYYAKRHYGAWWEKYNYLIEAGFAVGIAISAIIQTLALGFTGVELEWWGNTVSKTGLDYASYNQNASLLPVPEKGYFGPSPEQFPMNF